MYLYKYCPYSINSLSILINGKVWYSKPADFNDPFDGDFRVDERCTFEEYIQIIKPNTCPETYDLMKENYCNEDGHLKLEKFKLASNFLRVFKNIGVLCLTKRRDSTLMWSHYADQHRGFSVKFDVPENIPINPINYSKTLPKNHLSYYYNRHVNSDYVDIIFTKHTDWNYENEYRIAVQRGNRLLENPGKITEIIFGCKMSESHKETLSNLTRNLPESDNIEILESYKVDNLSLDFKPYNID